MGLLDNPIIQGDCLAVLKTLPDKTFHCCVTSPPYWGLRDYGVDGQLGLERTSEEYVAKIVEVFREVRRVLQDDGTLWLNLGDSYAMSTKGAGGAGKQHTNIGSVVQDRSWKIPNGIKPKDLVGIPWRVAFALQSDGWYLRSDIIWHKPNPMPESVTDRPTKAHEYIFLLAKSERYYYDHEAIKERAVNGDPTSPRGSKGIVTHQNSGNRKQDQVGKRQYTGFNERRDNREPLEMRNKRTVWTVTTKPFPEAHFATYPPDLIEPCILAGCPKGGIVLDPFGGSGTTRQVALENNRECVLIELNPEYIEIQKRRTATVQQNLF